MAGRILDLQFPQSNPSGATSAQGENIPTSPNMFGGFGARAAEEVGQGVEKAGLGVVDYFTEKQNQLNQVDAADQHTVAVKKMADVNAGYLSTEGRAALGARPDHDKQIKGIYDDALANASNPAVKRMVAQTLSRDVDRYYGYAADHAARQEAAFGKKVAADKTLSSMDQAVWAYRNGDYKAWDQYRQSAMEETTNFYLHELDPNETDPARIAEGRRMIDAKRAETNGNIILQTTKLILDHPQGGPGKASEFAEQYEKEIDAKSNIAIDGMLKGARATMEGNAKADQAISGSKLPAGSIAGIPANFIAGIKGSEGFEPQAKWDYKQFTNGYGTRATHSAEVVDRDTADRRFNSEITRAAQFVDTVNPNLDPGTRAALTSLTFNAGGGWASSGLGQKVRAGDVAGAKELFVQYNKAGGATNQGLADRRAREAAWFGQEDVAPGEAAQPAAYRAAGGGAAGPQAGAEAPQGAAVAGPGTTPQIDFRAAERRILDDPELQNNPQAQAAAFARLNKIKQVTEGQAADEERARKVAEKDAKDKSNQAEGTIMSDLWSDHPKFTAQQIIALGPGEGNKNVLDREAVDRLIGKLKEAPGGHEMNSYGPGYWTVQQSIHLPPGDPNRITDVAQLYRVTGPHAALYPAGAAELAKELTAMRTPQGESQTSAVHEFIEKQARPAITWTNPEFKKFDKDGETRFLRFKAMFDKELGEGLQAGYSLAGDLLNPDGPHYLGKMIPQFQAKDSDDLASKLADAPEPPSWFGRGLSGFLEAIGQSDYALPHGEPPSAGPAAAPTAATVPPQVDPASIKSKGELKALIASKQISWDDAAKLAMERDWVRKPPPPPPQVPMSQ